MVRGKTNEEYLKEILDRSVEPLEKYDGARTKILHRCAEGHEWEVRPDDILRGKGCPECANNQKRSTEEYKEELKDIPITVLGEYVNRKTKIAHKCQKCGGEWDVTPSSILNAGHGCPECAKKEVSERFKKSHDEYEDEIKDLPIEVLEEYIDTDTKITHRCTECGYQWGIRPDHVLRGRGCPKCAMKKLSEKKSKSHAQYVKEISAKPFIVLEQYVNAKTPILHKCQKCGYTRRVQPDNILNGVGCPECTKRAKSEKECKDHEVYVEELQDRKVTVVEEYIDARTKILHQCDVCDEKFKSAPTNILKGKGCPNCARSKGEDKISKILDNMNIKYEQEYRFDDCRNKKPLPFDFAILDNNDEVLRLIEYNGRQHYKPMDFFGGKEGFEELQKRDKIKKNYCKQNNIPLTIIPYTDKDNIEQTLKSELSPT